MSTRRTQSLPPYMVEPVKRERGRCVAAICFSWKVITCIVSHVTLVLLVVSYCVGGAYLFQHLEKPHEIDVKREIQYLRSNLTEKIWRFSDNLTVFNEDNWVTSVKLDLASFEKQLQMAIKADGWDGDEDVTKTQWTFAGSLFYSIIVITTIGYGHISPRTDWGKVTTIFYAIVGIPLMLLCLSTIGDVMATSFRFIYWRICCYVCTRTSRPRVKSRASSMRAAHRYTSRSQPPPFRRSMRLTQRSTNDSGFDSTGLQHAYSDPELRTMGRGDYERGRGNERQRGRHPHYEQGGRGHPIYEDDYDMGPSYTQTLNRGSRFSGRQRNRERMRDRHTVERERYLSRSKQYMDGSFEDFRDMQPPMKRALSARSMRSPQMPRNEPAREPRDARASRELHRLNSQPHQTHAPVRSAMNSSRGRAKSVDPRLSAHSAHYEDVDEEIVRKTPIISNRYALDDFNHVGGGVTRNQESNHRNYSPRSQSMPRSANRHMQSERAQRGCSPLPQTQRHSGMGRQQSRYGNHLELPEYNNAPPPPRSPRARSQRHDDWDIEDPYIDENENYPRRHGSRRHERRARRERQERLPPSPRIMSPMGFPVQRQIRRRPSYDYDEDSIYSDEYGDYYGDILPKDRPVPIWLCVFLVISYILGGAVLFAYWENWSFLDSAYFCFITLTTIGFGDFVPAKGVKDESQQSIAYCSLYLLFGIALLAMSFNLVQEEFIANVKEVAKRLGILKDEEEDD